MNFKNYQQLSKRTCNDLGSLQLNLSHMVLGIISEHEEYLEAINKRDMVNAREEQADKMFYVANYCTFRGFDLGDFENYEVPENQYGLWEIYTSKLADYVKKFIAYGKPINEDLEREALQKIIISIGEANSSFNFEKDLQINVDKLKARFPDKYSDELANNRDLEKEREILEEKFKYDV